MCETCGCGEPKVVAVDVNDRILSRNDQEAHHNREHFHEAGLCVINLMGSPGSGKTAVLEATARAAPRSWRLGAIVGDLATDHDAERLKAAGIPSVPITTGTACHLDAAMVHHALDHLSWRDLDILFIENVGNLVCPAVFDLGQTANVVAVAVTEGEDKPLKYPVMFRKADVTLVTKVDLEPHLPSFRRAALDDALRHTMPLPLFFSVCALTGAGIDRWIDWLGKLKQKAPAAAPAHAHTHL